MEIFLLLKSNTQGEKIQRFHNVTWLFIASFFFFNEMEVGCYFYRQMLEYCCNSLKRKGVLFFFLLRNAFPICFWDGVWSTVKSFHLSTTLQSRKTLEQTLSCKHLSKSPPRQRKGSWRSRDLPSFLKRSTCWTAFLNRGLSVRSLSGTRKPVVSTTLHRKSSCSWKSQWSISASRLPPLPAPFELGKRGIWKII